MYIQTLKWLYPTISFKLFLYIETLRFVRLNIQRTTNKTKMYFFNQTNETLRHRQTGRELFRELPLLSKLLFKYKYKASPF